jgi:hypothetical protein
MVEGAPIPSVFPGVVPAAINEASEIMQQLAKPKYIQTEYVRDKKGNVILETSWNLSALDIIMLIGAPATIFAVIRLMQFAAGGIRDLDSDQVKAMQNRIDEWLIDVTSTTGGVIGALVRSVTK